MTNAIMPKRKFDLEERTANFGIAIIKLIKKIPDDIILTRGLLSQLLKSGTSIGANYLEADDAESKKDFIHKIAICKKEARETTHWLRMLSFTIPNLKEEFDALYKEAKELNLIFNAIINSTKTPKSIIGH